jgi:hypothetical protein
MAWLAGCGLVSAGTFTPAEVARGNYAASHFTPAQGRVLYHQERLFRSAGGRGMVAHYRYLSMCARELLPARVDHMTTAQCVRALQLIERACTAEGLHHFRDVRTQWDTI